MHILLSKTNEVELNANEVIVEKTKGTLSKMIPLIMGAVSRAAVTHATDVGQYFEEEGRLDFHLLQSEIVLTSKRIIFYKTSFLGNATDIYSSIDLTEIKKVELTMQRMFWKLPSVRIHLKNEGKMEFWSPLVYKRKTMRLVNALMKNTENGQD